VLHEAAERLHRQRLRRASTVAGVGEPVQGIEAADAVGRGIGQRRCEVAESREGCCLAGVKQRIEMVGRIAAARGRVERGELEIRQGRTRRPRHVGHVGAAAAGIGATLTLQQPLALDRFGGIQMAADAGRLVVQRPHTVGIGRPALAGRVEHREKYHAFEQFRFVGGSGAGIDEVIEVRQL